MGNKYSDTEIREFAAALSLGDKDKLVAACVKKRLKCNLQAWYECVAHGRYWDNTLDGCTRPFQDRLDARDIATAKSANTAATRQPTEARQP